MNFNDCPELTGDFQQVSDYIAKVIAEEPDNAIRILSRLLYTVPMTVSNSRNITFDFSPCPSIKRGTYI